MTGPRTPIRLAVVNDYELIVAGVAALLQPYADRVRVVELDSRTEVISDVDIVLYDSFGQAQGERLQVDRLTRQSGAKVVVFSWNHDPALLAATLARGAAGYLSKGLSAVELVEALEQVATGVTVVPDAETSQVEGSIVGRWPGQDAGLTARESEIIALITQGLSNQEIAERSYLSINSVKTYIRTAYRKMSVVRRSQAVLWGIEHGFRADIAREVIG